MPENDDQNKGGADENKDDKSKQDPKAPENKDDKDNNDQEPNDQNQGKKDPVPYDEFAKARKERADALAKIREMEETQNKAKEEEMKKNNEFKELAEKKETEANENKAKYENALKKVRFSELALKEGVVNVDDAFRLADLSEVTLSDDGSVSGMEIVVEKLKSEKNYLFGSQDKSIGGGTNPPQEGQNINGQTFYKESQIKDPEFYSKNKEDIAKAYIEGRVIKD